MTLMQGLKDICLLKSLRLFIISIGEIKTVNGLNFTKVLGFIKEHYKRRYT